MHKMRVGALVLLALTLVIAGCGSSSKSSSSPAASPPASTPSTSAGTSSSAASGGSAQSTTSGASTTTQAALITTKHAGKLGAVLAFGPKRLTVYRFEADKPGSSSCTGACATVWPPVTGSPKAIAGAMSADLATITRPDRTKQVTYKGHALYLYDKDKDKDDTYGEGVKRFGAEWYALSTSGNKVDLS